MQHPKPEHEDSMNDRTIPTVTTTSRRSILVGSAGVLAAAGLAAATLASRSCTFCIAQQRRTLHEHDYHQRRHTDLLQGLGQRTTRGVQPWLAALGGCVRRSDVLLGVPRISMYRSRPPRPWSLESALDRQ